MATTDNYNYTDDNNITHPIRLSPARATAGGFSGLTSPASPIPAEVNARSSGLIPRRLYLYRTVGVGEFKKRKTCYLPIATKAAMGLYKFGQTVTIGGVPWTVGDTLKEKYRP